LYFAIMARPVMVRATRRASVGRRWHHRRVDGPGPTAGGRAPTGVFARLRDRAEWKFFAALPRANRRLAVAWWLILLVRGALPEPTMWSARCRAASTHGSHVSEVGSHDELLARGGQYADLYSIQAAAYR
jgi:hypothetical protein